MSRKRKFVILLAATGMVVSAVGVTAILQRATLEVIPPWDGTLWSLVEGPYEYISDETLETFDAIYVPGTYKGVGQTQYKGFALICFMGTPREPTDDSAREAWCIAWTRNTKTGLWEPGEPYLWGTVGDYKAWRDEVGLEPIGQ